MKCGVCGNEFKSEALDMAELIVQVGDILCHMEPCSLQAHINLDDGIVRRKAA